MKVLMTGSAGFIGVHLTSELERSGHEIVGIDRKGLHPTDLVMPGTPEWIVRRHKPDVVIHLAGKVGRLFGEQDLAETVLQNASVTARVAEACGKHGVRLMYASTSEVYGDTGPLIANEATFHYTKRLPHNLYGLSKRWGEEACRLYAPDGLTVMRLSMPYGPGLPAGVGRAAIINFLDQALRRVEIPVHRGAERSWCWVGDTVRAIRLLLERSGGGDFNVGRDDDPTPMTEVAKLACDLTGAPYTLIREVDPPAAQTVVKRLSVEKLRSLGWEPRVDLREGMTRTLEALTQDSAALALVA